MIMYKTEKSLDFIVQGTFTEPTIYTFDNGEIVLLNINKDKDKIFGRIFWRTLGSETEKSTDKQRLIYFLTDLPDSVLITKIQTFDQLYTWMSLKNQCIDIAKCLKAGHNSPDDPLYRCLDFGDVGKHYREKIWFSAELYENLWKLVFLKYEKIKRACQEQEWNFEFSNPLDLMKEIVAQDINSEFKPCLKFWHNQTQRENREFSTLSRKNVKNTLSTEERNRLNKLVQKYSQRNLWFDRIVGVSRLLAEYDNFIKVRIDIQDVLLDAIGHHQQKASCNPKLKSLGLQKSRKWKNGFLA